MVGQLRVLANQRVQAGLVDISFTGTDDAPK